MLLIKVKCPTCNGTGIEYDEHPHNGSRIGDGYTCTRCKGTLEIQRPATDNERIKMLEDKVKHLEAKIQYIIEGLNWQSEIRDNDPDGIWP